MKWVTWEAVGVDRMACAWLIQRFVDPDAVFVFVPAGQTPLPEGQSHSISLACGCRIIAGTVPFTPCCVSTN